MPYIQAKLRAALDVHLLPLVTHEAGALNYVITRIVVKFLYAKGEPNYERYNAALGVLTAAQQELYRRMVSVYEDRKRDENGDVYPPVATARRRHWGEADLDAR